jgi:hypothetical protein
MNARRDPFALPLALAVPLAIALVMTACSSPADRITVEVTYPAATSAGPLDGRLLLLLSADPEGEPRTRVTYGAGAEPIFGVDVEGWEAGAPATFTDTVFGFPVRRLGDLPAGRYHAQALLNRYETFHRADGKVVKLPPDRGEGQQLTGKPGNLYSVPVAFTMGGPDSENVLELVLDQEIPPVEDFAAKETEWVKYVRVRSDLLSDFWGTDMYLAAWVLLPAGFDEHPEARYPLAIFHGHFPSFFSAWRTEPADTTTPCVYSERFRVDCYNHTVEAGNHQVYLDWIAPGFPRHLVVEIQHPTPYYDDSYAVNSAAQGPWGDAIMTELIPEVERRYRGIGEGWARFTYGGSTGGWEAMAAQVFYPDDFNGAWIACPDPIDFRAYGTVNVYEDENAYYLDDPFKRTPRPALRDWLGHVSATVEEANHWELVLGAHSRSGGQWDIWEATFSPTDSLGYPARIWDKATGAIDSTVAAYWQDNYDLVHILQRGWDTLGPKLVGKLHIYAGDMDNLYLNDAVYLAEDFLESTTDPYYDGEVDYGDRAEHCWNGDHTRPNALSRLRYIQMFAPRMVERMMESHPPGADLSSWRY